jgi:hypothetical protein
MATGSPSQPTSDDERCRAIVQVPPSARAVNSLRVLKQYLKHEVLPEVIMSAPERLESAVAGQHDGRPILPL